MCINNCFLGEDRHMKLGVVLDCLKIPLPEGIAFAGELKIDGVQAYATSGAFSPDGLTESDKAYYKKILKDNGLVFSALCADMGGFGFQIEKDNPDRIAKTKLIIDLAMEFGAKVITSHIGVIPSDKKELRYKIMLDALTECGLYAKTKGITMAIETGPETANTLKAFLDDTKGGVGVNLDPANFVMVTDQDPTEAVYILKDYIVHTHIKDGIMLKKTDPKVIYDYFAIGGIEGLNVMDYFKETPIGQGNVDFKSYLKALKEIGYEGYLTIERECGDNPKEDMRLAIDYVSKFL